MGSVLGDFSERILVLEGKITFYNQPGNFPENTRRSTKVISLRRKKQRKKQLLPSPRRRSRIDWLAGFGGRDGGVDEKAL